MGSIRTIQFQVSDGDYMVNNTLGSLFFDFRLRSGLIQPNLYSKRGDVQMFTCPASGGNNFELKFYSSKINITGDGNAIGRGNNKVCVEKTGVQNGMPVVNVRRC